MKQIVICGGHLAPALALIEAIQTQHPDWQPVYIGRYHALEADQAVSLEFRTMQRLGIPFHAITAGRVSRYLSMRSAVSLLKVPWGIAQSFWYLMGHRPNVIVSFGGYVSFAVALAGWLLRIPVVLHEQTPVLGLSNRLIARIAAVVCISFPQTQGIPPHIPVMVTGNPMRQSVFTNQPSTYSHFGDPSRPLLAVTGGSLGSQTMNTLLEKIVPVLLHTFRIVHQCGAADQERDLKRLQALRATWPKALQENYLVTPHIPPESIGGVFHTAAVIVSRAGANTVYEIAQAGTPAVLIPLPWSAYQEQARNAALLAQTGLAVVLQQEGATPEHLQDTILTVYRNRTRYRTGHAQAKLVFPADAADKILLQLAEVMSA